MSVRQWLWLTLLATFWGSAFILMAIALPTFPPLVIVTGRMCVAAIVLNGVLITQHLHSQPVRSQSITPQPSQPRHHLYPSSLSLWLQCGGLSLLGNLLPFGLVVWAQQHITASLASILIAAAPIFTVVLAVFIAGERLTLVRALGITLGFSGVVVLIGPDVLQGFSLQGAGELAILGAAMSYALSGFWGRRFKHLPPQLVSTMTVTMGSLIILPLCLAAIATNRLQITTVSLHSWPLSAIFAVIALGVFSTALAYLIYYRLLAEVGVVKTSLVSFLVPFCALILGTTLLNEQLDAAALLGMALILSGLAVLDGRLLRPLSLNRRAK
ncbi:MAG: DMT family transporter [Cyanobacteria bacterium J06634_5]